MHFHKALILDNSLLLVIHFLHTPAYPLTSDRIHQNVSRKHFIKFFRLRHSVFLRFLLPSRRNGYLGQNHNVVGFLTLFAKPNEDLTGPAFPRPAQRPIAASFVNYSAVVASAHAFRNHCISSSFKISPGTRSSTTR